MTQESLKEHLLSTKQSSTPAARPIPKLPLLTAFILSISIIFASFFLSRAPPANISNNKFGAVTARTSLDSLFSPSCSEYAHCTTCVPHKSWISNCRWCPSDNRCHSFGSMDNPCRSQDNIKSIGHCSPTVDRDATHSTSFRLSTASQMVVYAYATYKDGRATIPNESRVVYEWEKPTADSQTIYGFAAVDDSRQRIVVSFRGTDSIRQLYDEAKKRELVPLSQADPNVRVNEYFLDGFRLISDGIIAGMTQLAADHPSYDIWLTGHSLGGALAVISFVHLHPRIANVRFAVYTLGQPRTGNADFAALVDRLSDGNTFRLVSNLDPVPHILPCVRNAREQCARLSSGYYHHGVEIWFPVGENSPHGVMCGYRECLGNPVDEDRSCSDGVSHLTVDWAFVEQHFWYQDVIDGGFCG